jgi:hypothetical protein
MRADEMPESDTSGTSSDDDAFESDRSSGGSEYDVCPPEPLEDGHSWQSVLPDIVARGLSAWDIEKKAKTTPTHERQEGDCTENSSDIGRINETNTCAEDRPKALSDPLAYPFYKFAPQYRNCLWEIELPNIDTTIWHIIVHHRQLDHCPICYEAFGNRADCDKYIVARSCRPAILNKPTGVPEE